MELPEYEDLPSARTEPTGNILPRYRDVFQVCHDTVVDRYGQLVKLMFTQLDQFMLSMAENAGNNAERNHCFEVMHELLLRQGDIERKFSSELSRGFANFAEGNAEPIRSGPEVQRADQLSLIEQDDYEIALAFTTLLQRANNEFSAHLFALNHRLAVLNGGIKLGEYHPGLPGSPAQVCDALQNALDLVDIPISHTIKVALAVEFDQKVLREAEGIYADFNDTLIKAGILPNLSLEAIGYKPTPSSAGQTPPKKPEASEPEATEEDAQDAAREEEGDVSSLDREIFSSIQEILARRHGGPSAAAPRSGAAGAASEGMPAGFSLPGSLGAGGAGASANAARTDFVGLLNSLNTLQVAQPILNRQELAERPLEEVKQAFAAQLGRLADIVREQQVNSADADIIDLVGMLFEFILNDTTLPDSVKALLSHLHTPILKVALLDKKFFFRSKHPCRRLLNSLTQAGGLCNAEDGDEQGVFAKMQSIVDQILHQANLDPDFFAKLVDEFAEFMDNYNRRAKVSEKRAVETAKGRERLREARQSVSQEIVDRTWNRRLPKAAEEILLGPWANLLVLTLLRSGDTSEEWKHALSIVDEVIWTLGPHANSADKQKARERIPVLEAEIRKGLALIGDPEVNTNSLLKDLVACQYATLETAPTVAEAMGEIVEEVNIDETPPKAIWEDVEVATPVSRQPLFLRNAEPELVAIVEQLRGVKLGATFEFTNPKTRRRFRAKLSWYSPKTSYYIFVNQAGIQIAVKSLRNLAKEIQKGEALLVPQARKPLVDRALETIHSLLEKTSSGYAAPEAGAVADR